MLCSIYFQSHLTQRRSYIEYYLWYIIYYLAISLIRYSKILKVPKVLCVSVQCVQKSAIIITVFIYHPLDICTHLSITNIIQLFHLSAISSMRKPLVYLSQLLLPHGVNIHNCICINTFSLAPLLCVPKNNREPLEF